MTDNPQGREEVRQVDKYLDSQVGTGVYSKKEIGFTKVEGKRSKRQLDRLIGKQIK